MTTGAAFATNSIVHASASATRRTASTGMAAGGFLWGLTGLSETSKIRKSQQAQAETIQKIAEKVGVKFDKPNKKTGNSSWWNRK